MTVAVTLIINQPLPKGVEKALLNKACQLTFNKFGSELKGALELTFVDKKKSQELNNKYAGDNYPTDVLAFNYQAETDLSPTDLIGEIVICSEIAQTQAREHNLLVKAEVSLLFIHGMLHLLKYDHQNPASQSRFSALQDGIMEELALKSRQFEWSH